MRKQRLLGIELCRGIAAYAVIVVHSGDETWGVPIEASAIVFRLLFYFAVPFFLALSFYFLLRRAVQQGELERSNHFWRSRLQRLVLPYTVWTIIFFITRYLAFAADQDMDRLQSLTTDPLAIAFLGEASYHLYFLPLLLSGTALLLFLPILRQVNPSRHSLLLLSVASVILYSAIDLSSNGFLLGQGSAFQSVWNFLSLDIDRYPVLRILSVWVAWTVRCSPYFFISLCLHRYLPFLESIENPIILAIALLTFVSANIANVFLPDSLCEVLGAYSLLLTGFVLSNLSPLTPFRTAIASIGSCSFGIYIIHPFLMVLSKGVLTRIYPKGAESITIYSMVVLSLLCFLGSWLTVYCLSRNRCTRRYLFGT